jgi:hypothetical protein
MATKKFFLISMAMFCFVMICFFWMQSLAYGQRLHEIRAEIQKMEARGECSSENFKSIQPPHPTSGQLQKALQFP